MRCWFFLSVSSGIFVNVGRSLRLAARAGAAGAHARFGIPCTSSTHCDKAPGDKLYCHFARAEGFDSVQIRDAHGNPEARDARARRERAALSSVRALANRARARPARARARLL